MLVNNAGTMRNKSFAKMDLDDFQPVIEVHVTGRCIADPYSNFGQSNDGAAKMALVGLMQTMTEGFFLRPGDLSAETLVARLEALADRGDKAVPGTCFDQLTHEIGKARAHLQELRT